MEITRMIKRGTKFKERAARERPNLVSFGRRAERKWAQTGRVAPEGRAKKQAITVIIVLTTTLILLANSRASGKTNAQEISSLNGTHAPDQVASGSDEAAERRASEPRSSSMDRKSSISAQLKSNKRLRKLLARPRHILSSFVPHILTKQLILKRPRQVRLAAGPAQANQLAANLITTDKRALPQANQLRLIKLEPIKLAHRPVVALSRPAAPLIVMGAPVTAGSAPTNLLQATSTSRIVLLNPPVYNREPLFEAGSSIKEPVGDSMLEAAAAVAAAAAAAAEVAADENNQDEEDEERGQRERQLNQIDQMIKDELESRLNLNENIMRQHQEGYSTAPSVSSSTGAYLNHEEAPDYATGSEPTRMTTAASNEQVWRPAEPILRASFPPQFRPELTRGGVNSQVQFNDSTVGAQDSDDEEDEERYTNEAGDNERFKPVSGFRARPLNRQLYKQPARTQRGPQHQPEPARHSTAFVPSALKTIAHLNGHQAAYQQHQANQTARQRSVVYGEEPLISSMTAAAQSSAAEERQHQHQHQLQEPAGGLDETLRKLRQTKAKIRELQAELNATESGRVAPPPANLTVASHGGQSRAGSGAPSLPDLSAARQRSQGDWFRALWAAGSGNNQQLGEQIAAGQPTSVRQQEAMNMPLGMYHKGPLTAPARLVASAIGRKLSAQTARAASDHSALRPTSGPILLGSTMTVAGENLASHQRNQMPTTSGPPILIESFMPNKVEPRRMAVGPASWPGENNKAVIGILAGEPNRFDANQPPAVELANQPPPAGHGNETAQQRALPSWVDAKQREQQPAESVQLQQQHQHSQQSSPIQARKLPKNLLVARDQSERRQLGAGSNGTAPGELERRNRQQANQTSAEPAGGLLGELFGKLVQRAPGNSANPANSPTGNKLTTERVLFSLISLSCSLATLCLLVIVVTLRCQRRGSAASTGSRRRMRRRLAMRGSSLSATCATASTSAGAGSPRQEEEAQPSSSIGLEWRRCTGGNQSKQPQDKLILDGTMRNVSLLARHPVQVPGAKQRQKGQTVAMVPMPMFNRSCCHCVTCSESWLFRDTAPSCPSGFYHPIPRGKLPFGAASSVNKLLEASVQLSSPTAAPPPPGQIYARNPVGGTRMRMMQAIEEADSAPAAQKPLPLEEDSFAEAPAGGCNCKAATNPFCEPEESHCALNANFNFNQSQQEDCGAACEEAQSIETTAVARQPASLSSREWLSEENSEEEVRCQKRECHRHRQQTAVCRAAPPSCWPAGGGCCPREQPAPRLGLEPSAGGAFELCREQTGAKCLDEPRPPASSSCQSFVREAGQSPEETRRNPSQSRRAACQPTRGEHSDGKGCRGLARLDLNSVFGSPISLAAGLPAKLKRSLIGQRQAKQVPAKSSSRRPPVGDVRKPAQCSASGELSQRL